MIITDELNHGNLIFRSENAANFYGWFWEMVTPSLFLIAMVIILIKSACCGYKCRDGWTPRDCLKRPISGGADGTGAADGVDGTAGVVSRVEAGLDAIG